MDKEGNYIREIKKKNSCEITCFLKINKLIKLKKKIYLFIFGSAGSLLLHGLSLVVESGGYSSLQCMGFSLQWFLLLRCLGSRALAQELWHLGF